MSLFTESLFILSCVGLWKPADWQNWKEELYYIQTIFVIYMNITFIISVSIDLIFFNNGIFDFIQNMAVLITVIGMGAKIVTILSNHKLIIKVIADLDHIMIQPRDEEEKKIFTDSNDTIRFYTLCYAAFFNAALPIFALGRIFRNKSEDELPWRAWLPYNYTNSQITYWLASSQQMITLMMSVNVDIGHDTLFPGLMLQVCAQLQVLKHRLRVMLNNSKNSIINQKENCVVETLIVMEKKLFVDCVEYHLFILRLVDRITSIFSQIIFIQYTFSSLILCTSVYALSQLKPFSFEFMSTMIYIFCMFFQIFYICITGNCVNLEFAELNTAMYNTDWYTLTNNGRKYMSMMMVRSLKPIVVDSGHLVTLSLESFKNLLKLSYTIFNVFQKTS